MGGYIYTGLGRYYFRNGHVYSKHGGQFKQLAETRRFNKTVVFISVNGVKQKLVYDSPDACGKCLNLNRLLTDVEYALWQKKMNSLPESEWRKFNEYALRKYLRASYILKKNPERRKKFFEKLFNTNHTQT